LDFEKAMKAEHCSMGGFQLFFEISNYNIQTCPANEWAITVGADYTNADLRHERRLEKIEQLMQKEVVLSSKLIRCEVIAIVLYTGPMVS
jgi:hypothetical protein